MNNPYADPNNYQQVPQRGGARTGKVLLIIFGVLAVVGLLCAGVMAILLFPAVSAARSAAQRVQSQNNLKQIALAFYSYEEAYGNFPPAYTVDGEGNKLHSWRTIILPYIEQEALFQNIDLTKPWDDPVNLPFTTVDIPTYMSAAVELGPGQTSYVAVVDPSGVFSGEATTELRDIGDGTSNTLAVVEVGSAQAVSWMSPSDMDLQTFTSGNLETPHLGVFNAAMCDGSVQPISESLGPQDRAALVSKDGSEPPIGF
ncbi:MAG: DUF1559 domain-containing protein [Planctomycetota bacterium]